MAAVERLGSNTPYRVIGQAAGISTSRIREHVLAMGWPRRPHGGEARRQRHLEVQASILAALDRPGRQLSHHRGTRQGGVAPLSWTHIL
jgi:hypothetical protein